MTVVEILVGIVIFDCLNLRAENGQKAQNVNLVFDQNIKYK